MNSKNLGNTKTAFTLVTILFFLWGFAHNLDPILIPHLKRSFSLTTAQSTLVDSAVYIAYFLMAIPAGYLMKRLGYKIGIVIGLFLFAMGAFLFIPAANVQSYGFFLVALFIIACGLTILETAGNPYVSTLGSPETGTQRLNLAQSFNGLAAALAPVVGARLILTSELSDEQLNSMTLAAKQAALAAEASSVKIPYLVLGVVLVFIALIFAIMKLPVTQREQNGADQSRNILQVFRYRNLRWAVVAQFFYVGAQVSVFSLFILYASETASISQVTAADYLGLCGIAFLVGRFLGTFLMRYILPQRLLAIYAIVNISLSFLAIFLDGMTTVYVIIAICFFMSIMFPTIFALGIKGLGSDTEYGSSLIVMSIVGGAILPLIFGIVSDCTGNIQYGYVIPLVCFIVVALFALKRFDSFAKD